MKLVSRPSSPNSNVAEIGALAMSESRAHVSLVHRFPPDARVDQCPRCQEAHVVEQASRPQNGPSLLRGRRRSESHLRILTCIVARPPMSRWNTRTGSPNMRASHQKEPCGLVGEALLVGLERHPPGIGRASNAPAKAEAVVPDLGWPTTPSRADSAARVWQRPGGRSLSQPARRRAAPSPPQHRGRTVPESSSALQ